MCVYIYIYIYLTSALHYSVTVRTFSPEDHLVVLFEGFGTTFTRHVQQ